MRQTTGTPSGRMTFCERISLMQVVPGGGRGDGEVNQAREGHTPRMKGLSAAKVMEERNECR